MASISLAAYSIRVRDRYTHQNCTLGDFGGSKDLLNDVESHLKTLKKDFNHDENARKLLRVAMFHVSGRLINGIIETGEYGYTSELLNVGSYQVAHKRTVEEAELLPFYFLFYIPEDADEGVMIFEKFKTFGIRTLFANGFKAAFSGNHPDHLVVVNHLAPSEVFEAYQKQDGEIKQITFTSFQLPKTIEDRFGVGGHKEEDVYVEFKIKAKRNSKIPAWESIQQYFKGKNRFNSLVEIPNFKAASIKVEVNVSGRSRTLNLTDRDKIRANYDISTEVDTDRNGHPKFSSIDELAKGILDEQLARMGKRLK